MTTTTLHEVQVPTLGESVSEATIANWLKTDGQQVNAGDIIAELETDKATVELPAGHNGVFHPTKPKVATVAVGDTIATIDPAGTPSAASPAAPGSTPAPKAPAPKEATPLAPSVQRMVTEGKLNPANIPATGKAGRITKEDVTNYLTTGTKISAAPAAFPAAGDSAAAQRPRGDQQAMTSPGTTTVFTAPAGKPGESRGGNGTGGESGAAGGGGEKRVEMSKLRQTIAKRLVESQHATASLTTFNEIDMSAVMALREKYKERFEKAHQIGLGFMSFFAKAVINALKAVPAVNAAIDTTADRSAVVYRDQVHLGVAVSTEKGLMVPVVRNAERLSMAQIEAEIKRLAGRARENKITPDEMAGGTFTITNGGVFGSLLSTPILNPPQSGILGMHKIEKRAVVITDAHGQDTIAIRPMMYVALTYDHRVIDGQQSVTFLVKVKEAIEDPARLLLEI